MCLLPHLHISFRFLYCGEPTTPASVTTADYSLIVLGQAQATVVLFPRYLCDTADTRSEPRIVEDAIANGVAVLLMQWNRHLILSESEAAGLVDTITNALSAHGPDKRKVVLGSFPSGVNAAVLLAKRLVNAPRTDLPLKGLFVVDPPLDLTQLYPVRKEYTERSQVAVSRDEGAMVVVLLDSTLPIPWTTE